MTARNAHPMRPPLNDRRIRPAFQIGLRGLLLFAFLGSSTAVAGKQADYMGINAFCIDYLNTYRSDQRAQLPSFPNSFYGQTHYCLAVEAHNKLFSTTNPQQRRFLVQTVVGETSYILSHNQESHPLMPEVYALRGRAQMQGKQMPQAEGSLNKALQLDPSHVGAMHTLATLYMETNRKAKATETVKAGVAIDPGHKGLRRLARELGVKVEDPRPGEAGQEKPTSKTAPALEPTTPPPASVKQAPVPPLVNGKDGAEKTEKAKPEAKYPSPSSTPPTGSPTNPWCRFCPDDPSPDRPASTPSTDPKAAP